MYYDIFCYYSTNSETKFKQNFKQFDQPTCFDVLQNHHQYISTYYTWLYMNPFSQVETSVKGKYTFDSIMNYDFKYVSCVTFQKLHNKENFEIKKSN